MPRPKVPTTRSFTCRCTARSRTAMVGRPPLSCVHFLPPSRVTNSPNSVPAKSRSGRTWSSAKASTEPRPGRSPAIGVRPPELAHDGQLVAVELPGQVGADGLPVVAAVVAAEELVGREVHPGVRVRADHQRRVPVPAQRRLARAGDRLDRHPLAGLAVE